MALTTQGAQVVATGLVSTPLALAALGLRLWSRRIQRLRLAFNDYMAIIAAVLATATVSICLADAFIGAIGAHAAALQATRPQVLMLYSIFFTPGQLLWAAANTSVKISILSLYTTLFPTKTFTRICIILMGVSTAYFLSVFLETFLLCTPVQYNWDKTIPNGVCHNPNNIAYLLAGITNLIIDAIIVALPMPKLYKLQIPLARRLAIGAMFALGAVICVISLLRILAILSWNLDDSTYTGTGIAIYSILEPTFGVVNTCLPTIRPALRKLFDHDAFTVARKDSQFSKGSSSGYAHQHRFSQLTDDVPLTQIHAVGAPRETPEGDNNITIMREWKVSLTKQDDADITRDQQKNY